MIDWTGATKDVWREVDSPEEDSRIVVVIHHVPRFACCTLSELPEEFSSLVDLYPAVRTTTLTYESGEVDYIVDRSDESIFEEWHKLEPWCGQTVFFLKKKGTEESWWLDPERNAAVSPSQQEASCVAAGQLPSGTAAVKCAQTPEM